MQMNFEDLGQGVEERHIDMEGQIINEPIGELEPMDDDKMFGEEESDAELSEVEKSIQASFINEGLPVVEPQPDFVDENPEALLDGAIMDEGPALDVMGQPISTFNNYFPYEEAREGMEKTNAGAQLDLAPENDENTLTRQVLLPVTFHWWSPGLHHEPTSPQRGDGHDSADKWVTYTHLGWRTPIFNGLSQSALSPGRILGVNLKLFNSFFKFHLQHIEMKTLALLALSLAVALVMSAPSGVAEKSSPEVKVEQELKKEPEVKVEQEPKAEPEVKVEQEPKKSQKLRWSRS
ncbi:hypothetical protein INR49_030328 [Caranx melampygus]|nr:hypothetical protein INR49_030328 [Caranx melampygus]